MATEYEYSPLPSDADDIRLLELHPGNEADDIAITIQHRSLLSEAAIYDALSYVWGSTDDPVAIKVKSALLGEDSSLSVTRNLAVALQHLRSPDIPRTFWIDAICIDQKNTQERSKQVLRMNRIYSEAVQVVIWLGPASTDSDLAIRLLCHLYSMVRFDTRYQCLTTTLSGRFEPHWADLNTNLPWSKAEIRAITRLTKRQWFTRLWVLQEVIANPNTLVRCGTSETTWETLFSSIMCLLHKRIAKGWKQGALSRFVSISDAFCTAKRPELLYTAVHRARTLECADQRDKVYAVLGITSNPGQVKPDYTLSEAEVYRQLAMAQLEYQDLNILSYCDLDSRKVAGPTWVPDWSSDWTTQRMPWNNAAGSVYVPVTERLDDGLIQVVAVRADTLCKMDAISIPSSDARAIATEVARLAPALVESLPYKTGCSLLEAFCGTLATLDLNMLGNGTFNLTSYGSTEAVRCYLRCAEGAPLNDFVEERVYGGYLWGAVQDRAFVSTDEGYIGLAPKHAREGDVVYAIISCRSLIVLRPVEGFETRFQVVGECFLYGLNHGEAVFGNLPDHIRGEYFFYHEGGMWLDAYRNVDTDETSFVDPRLLALGIHPVFAAIYRQNSVSGETLEILEKAGVKIDHIDLV